MSIEFKLPELGENVHSGDVVNVLVQEGDEVAANDGVLELETDKAVVEIPCPHAGRIEKLHVQKGDTIKVGQLVMTLDEASPAAVQAKPAALSQPAAQEAAPPAASKPSVPPPAAPPETGEDIPAGPATRRLARELGVDLAQVQGSGKHGRITPEDVEATIGGAGAPPRTSSRPASMPVASVVTPPGEPGSDAWGAVRREAIPRIRRTIAEQMARSAQIIPHVTNCDDADVTDLDRLRHGVRPDLLGANIKLTMMPFVLKAVATVLKRHPLLNASLDEEQGQIVYKEYVHLGIAVDTPRGLVVPKIRDADRMTVIELAQALASLAERARAAQFSVEELRGGTFTLSNLGAIGGTYSTPIINHPEVAILLLGRSRWIPVVRGENHDRVEIREMMPLSLSYDHRLVDGATAGRFLNEVIRMLEAPGNLLLA